MTKLATVLYKVRSREDMSTYTYVSVLYSIVGYGSGPTLTGSASLPDKTRTGGDHLFRQEGQDKLEIRKTSRNLQHRTPRNTFFRLYTWLMDRKLHSKRSGANQRAERVSKRKKNHQDWWGKTEVGYPGTRVQIFQYLDPCQDIMWRNINLLVPSKKESTGYKNPRHNFFLSSYLTTHRTGTWITQTLSR